MLFHLKRIIKTVPFVNVRKKALYMHLLRQESRRFKQNISIGACLWNARTPGPSSTLDELAYYMTKCHLKTKKKKKKKKKKNRRLCGAPKKSLYVNSHRRARVGLFQREKSVGLFL